MQDVLSGVQANRSSQGRVASDIELDEAKVKEYAKMLREYNRQTHAAYVKMCRYFGLHEYGNILDIPDDADVVFSPDMFYFVVNNEFLIYDYTIDAKETDHLFKLCALTVKRLENTIRQAKRKSKDVT